MNWKKLLLMVLTVGAFGLAAVPESKAGVSVGIGIGVPAGYPYGYYPYGYRYGYYPYRHRFRPVIYITNGRRWYWHRGHRVYVGRRHW